MSRRTRPRVREALSGAKLGPLLLAGYVIAIVIMIAIIGIGSAVARAIW